MLFKAYVPRLSPLTNKFTYLYFNDGKPFSLKVGEKLFPNIVSVCGV